jgi:hypothetical protein
MWHLPSIDTTHALYQPDKRAKATAACHRAVPSEVDPRAQGTIAEREQWMRDRQQGKRELQHMRRALQVEPTEAKIRDENMRMAELEGQREAELLAEAASEIRHRRKREGVE